MLEAKLVVVGGDAKTTEVKLRLPTVIGRGKEGVTLTLPHKLVSRQHTEIFEQKGYLFVRDLGSLNGTYVNNERIAESVMLRPNELLTLGNVTFRAVYEIPKSSPVETASAPAATASENKGATKEIQFDEVAKNDSQESSSEPAPEPMKAQDALSPVLPAAEKEPVEPVQSDADPDVLNDPAPEDGGSKTDKSLVDVGISDRKAEDSSIDSSIFSLDDENESAANKSVSLSSLDSLPSGTAQVSFVGNMNFEGVEAAAKEVESIELDLGEKAKQDQPGEAELGSFLKKLPK